MLHPRDRLRGNLVRFGAPGETGLYLQAEVKAVRLRTVGGWSSVVAEYVSTRRVGEAKVTVIRDATDLWIPQWQAPEVEWRRAIPEADAAGEMSFDMSVFHVALGGASVLVDLGFGDAPERYMKRVPYL